MTVRRDTGDVRTVADQLGPSGRRHAERDVSDDRQGEPVDMKGPGYDIQVPWSVRFTWSGDYSHDAYWSVGPAGLHERQPRVRDMPPANAGDLLQDGRPRRPRDDHRQPPRRVRQLADDVVPAVEPLAHGSALHKAARVNRHGSSFFHPHVKA